MSEHDEQDAALDAAVMESLKRRLAAGATGSRIMMRAGVVGDLMQRAEAAEGALWAAKRERDVATASMIWYSEHVEWLLEATDIDPHQDGEALITALHDRLSRLSAAEAERDAARAQAAALREALGQSYHGYAMPSDVRVQYVGVYTLRWGRDDEPSMGFARWTDEEIAALGEEAGDGA